MARACLIVFLVAAATLATAAQPGLRSLPVARGAIQLDIPDAWISLDPAALGNLRSIVAEGVGGSTNDRFVAAYVPPSFGLFPGPPALLVYEDASGRLPWGMFLRTPDVAAARDAARSSLVIAGLPFGHGVRIDTVSFDRRRLMLEVNGVVEGTPWGTIGIRSCTLLTSTGTISLHGLIRPGQAPTYDPLFDHVFTSAALGPELVYHRHLSDLWPWILRLPLTWYVLSALTAVAAVGVAIRDRRLRSAS